MAILDKLTWIDGSALTRFILSAQVRSAHTRFCSVISCFIMCFFCFFLMSFFALGGLIGPTFY